MATECRCSNSVIFSCSRSSSAGVSVVRASARASRRRAASSSLLRSRTRFSSSVDDAAGHRDLLIPLQEISHKKVPSSVLMRKCWLILKQVSNSRRRMSTNNLTGEKGALKEMRAKLTLCFRTVRAFVFELFFSFPFLIELHLKFPENFNFSNQVCHRNLLYCCNFSAFGDYYLWCWFSP